LDDPVGARQLGFRSRLVAATWAVVRPAGGFGSCVKRETRTAPAAARPFASRPTIRDGQVVSIVGLARARGVGFRALFYLRRGFASRYWPTVEARVTSSTVDEDSDGQFSTEVSYTYEVGGQTYRRTETLNSWLPTRENAEGVRRRHPVGGTTAVRYDPSRPRVAVMRPGVSVWMWVGLILGTGVTALGVAMLSGAVPAG
jgi:hypothetical protein